MSRLIQNEVKKPLAEKILFGELKEGGHVVVGTENEELCLTVTPSVPVEPALN
jgi:ATP-dependent Clp protease ATP-binding subunit ClpA